MSIPKMYEVHLKDIMKIHDIACDTWKEIIMESYISKVHNLKLTKTFFQSDVDKMFKAATSSQVPVLEQVFGKQVEKIEWNKIKTGSKVKIKYSGLHVNGWDGSMDDEKVVDVVFFGTKCCFTEKGDFRKDGMYNSYWTFIEDGQFILFGSNDYTAYENFVVEVIEY
jgi:hypothetical protein